MNFMKRVMVIILLFSLVFSCNVPAYASSKTVYAKGDTQLYRQDTKNKKKLKKSKKLKKGDSLKIVATKGDWGKTSDGQFVQLKDLSSKKESKKKNKTQTKSQKSEKKAPKGDIIIVDIKKQTVQYYKNGELVVEGDCVTGNSHRSPTPKGLFKIKSKSTHATLRGGKKVKYWLPFNGSIGLHDAPWRQKFGGHIYRGGGSLGCVNLPDSIAKKIFKNSSSGKTNVLVH